MALFGGIMSVTSSVPMPRIPDKSSSAFFALRRRCCISRSSDITLPQPCRRLGLIILSGGVAAWKGRCHEASAARGADGGPGCLGPRREFTGQKKAERHAWLSALANLISQCENPVGIVVGGGAPAREAIELAKPIVEDVASLDEIGIAATRLNASIVAQVLQGAGVDVCVGIPSDVASAARGLETHHVVVMGGTRPGHTTDNVAIRLAIEWAARCLIATNVSHVYTSDLEN